MASLLDRIIGGTYGRRRFQRLYRRVHEVSLIGLNYGYSDATLNGEHAFLDRVTGTWNGRQAVVLDVGAFHGEWSAAVLERAPSAQVHAFEPIPASFAQLEKNIGERAQLHPCALSSEPGEAEMTAPEASPDWASLHARDLSRFGVDARSLGTVAVRTLDDFCAEHDIDQIDLLKLDTEGNELAVLAGASRMLDSQSIAAIQLEVGGANIDARVFLREIVRALSSSGYEVFRMLRDGLEPVLADEREEIFTYANYVALSPAAVENAETLGIAARAS
jgi:FkbM family methyltransferase